MKRAILSLTVCLIFWACNTLTHYNAACDFDSMKWSVGQNATFEFYPTSTLSEGHIKIGVRHELSLVDTTLHLVIRVSNPPLNTTYADTLPIKLMRGRGKRIPTTTLNYREGVVWQNTDKHTISISCLEDIEGIMGVSLEVENALPK